MARQPTTRLHVSGYRFLLRRMEHALVRGDVRMLDDPLRAQTLSLLAGVILTVIAVAVGVLLAVVHPPGGGTAPILLVRDTGAMYVRIGDTVHPVLNLASARLIAGTAAEPELVSASAISSAKRGPLVGIAGAPAAIGAALAESRWAVCDTAAGTTVIVGDSRPDPDRTDAVLVTAPAESATTVYLLYDGRRAMVDLRNRAVLRALRLDGLTPQPVSRALLELVPEVPAIVVPAIPHVGGPGHPALGGLAVGTVVRVDRAAGSEYYVVLADGVQRISVVTADLIRFGVPQPDGDMPVVAAARFADVPVVSGLPVTTFPERAHLVRGAVVCAWWSAADGAPADIAVTAADSVAEHRPAVPLAQADGPGPGIDVVVMAAGRSAYVRSTDVMGGGGPAGTRYLVTDLGVVFGVHDDQAAAHLGLSGPALPAPWPLLALLPHGPELSKEGASVARGGVPAASG